MNLLPTIEYERGLRIVLAVCVVGILAPPTVSPSRAAGLGGAGPTSSGVVRPSEAWGCDAGGRVLRQAVDRDTLYVCGSFGAAGRSRGKFLVVDTGRGAPYPRQANVAGRVRVILPDGGGGWYIAGDVASAGGLPRSGLAHVLANGAPDAWAPVIDGTVFSIALAGGTLYVGGAFGHVDGEPRSHLAAIDLTTHRVLPWRPEPDDAVYAIKPFHDRIFFGGAFMAVAGQARAKAAAWDLAADRLLPWAPQPDADVLCIEVMDSVVVLGGHFESVSGVPRTFAASVSLADGTLQSWAPQIHRLTPIFLDGGARVSAMYVRDSLLYIGGSFDHVGGLERNSIACVNLHTGQPTDWDAHARWFYAFELPQFRSFCASGGRLYVGGVFAELGGRDFGLLHFGRVGYAAALDLRTGAATDWDPRLDHNVWAIGSDGQRVALGGDFALAWDWVHRTSIASFDLTTGALTSWDPQLNGLVYRMCIHGRTLYFSGDFTRAFGQPRGGLAAIDLDSGALKPWNPSPDMNVWAIDAEDSVVRVGGAFRVIGGVTHPYVAALDPETGAVLPWNPAPDDWVNTIVHGDDAIYLGGIFTTLRGQRARFLAAVSPDSGARLIWEAEADNQVNAMAPLDTTLYVGGVFGNLGGEPRVGLGAVSIRTGLAEPWRADLTSYAPGDLQLISIAPTANGIYVGGAFTGIAGTSQARIAALDPVTAQLLDWRPRIDPDRVVWDVLVSGPSVHLGGDFTYVDTQPVGGYGQVPALGVPPPPTAFPGPRLNLHQNTPNPTSDRTAIRFSTPHVGVARVGLFDLQGRLLDSREIALTASGGEHEVVFRTGGLRPGCYVYRVQAGGETATRRMVVFR